MESAEEIFSENPVTQEWLAEVLAQTIRECFAMAAETYSNSASAAFRANLQTRFDIAVVHVYREKPKLPSAKAGA